MNELLPKFYTYKPKATTIIMCILFFGLCALVLGFKAANNDKGLTLNGILTLSQQGASIFYWILTAASLVFVAIGFLLVIQRTTGNLHLELSENELKIPHGLIRKTLTSVSLAEVTEISETKVQGQTFLYLHTSLQKFCVNKAFMPSKESYEEIKELLGSMVTSTNETNT